MGATMTNSASHVQSGPSRAPTPSAESLISRWRERGRIPVPTSKGHLDALIVSLSAPDKICNTPVDALAEARATHYAPVKKFAVVIGPEPPAPLSIPVLWVRDLEKTGEWVAIS